MRRARARRRSRGGHERCERVPPNRGGDHEDGDDDHRQEDEHDHEPVHDLQGPRNLSAEQGDSEYEEQKPDPERLDGGKLRRSPRAAEDEREEAFARSLRPTSPDECKVEQEHREGCPEPETGGHAAEGDDGSFTGCEGETPDFDPKSSSNLDAYADERPSTRFAHSKRRERGAATDSRAVYLPRRGKGVLIFDSRGAHETRAVRWTREEQDQAIGPSPFGRRPVYFPRCPRVLVFSGWPRNWVRSSERKTSSPSPVPSRLSGRTWRTSRLPRRS